MRKVGWASVLLFLACGVEHDAPVRVGPTLLFPKGILEQVTRLVLRSYDPAPGLTCDPERGLVDGDNSGLLLEQELGSEDCPGGASFCGDVVIRRSANPYIFVASAENQDGKLIASGCETLVVNDPKVSLNIQMKRYLEPATCGNGTLEPTELCDPPNAPDDSVCDSKCQTNEVYLSNGRSANNTTGTVNGKPGDKERPVFVWPSAKGQNGKFLAFFTDKSPATREVTVRVRSDAFGRYTAQGPEVGDYSFFLPTIPTQPFPEVPKETPANQSAPAAIAINGRTWVAFEDDDAGDLNIKLRSVDATLTAEQSGGAILLSGATSGDPGTQSLPAIAVNKQGILFVAWQDETDGSIRGRAYTPDDGTKGSIRVLSTGSANKNVRLAGVGSGFIAVWESGSEIRLSRLSPDGTPSPEEKVNDGALHPGPVSHPDVTALPDNRFAVVFSDRGDIFVQRHGTDGKPIAKDQESPLNAIVTAGDQYGPVIAPMPSAGGSYAVAWIDGASGDARAAYLGGSASFLFNPIDGQPSEFVASKTPGRKRTNVTIAVGGLPAADGGPFVVVGWEDTSSDAKAGVYGRRLPLPQ